MKVRALIEALLLQHPDAEVTVEPRLGFDPADLDDASESDLMIEPGVPLTVVEVEAHGHLSVSIVAQAA